MHHRAIVSFRSERSWFRGYALPPPLDRYVELVWMLDGAPDGRRERVLPNGVVELIFNFGPPHRVLRAGVARHRRVWLAGIQSSFLDIQAEGETHLLGIRFRPGGALPLLGVPMDELADEVVELEALEPRWARSLHDELGNVSGCDVDCARLAIVTRALERRVGLRPRDGRVSRACRALASASESRTVASIASDLGISHQQLIRLFAREVGLRPKVFARVARFQSALSSLASGARSHPTRRVTNVAHALGYFDQAHFAREFRALSGTTAGEYLQRRAADPNHLFFDA